MKCLIILITNYDVSLQDKVGKLSVKGFITFHDHILIKLSFT